MDGSHSLLIRLDSSLALRCRKGAIHPIIRSPRRRGPVESDLSMKIKTHFVFASTVWGRRTRFVRLRLCLKPTLASWPLVREFAARFDPAGVVAAVSTRESIGDARAYRDLA